MEAILVSKETYGLVSFPKVQIKIDPNIDSMGSSFYQGRRVL